MQTRAARWGHSLADRIPKSLADACGLQLGMTVDLELRDGAVELRPVARRTPSLAELVNAITADNRHDETDWGEPCGGEVWPG
ncbi:MAG: antitoxin MazE [Fimbriimonadaceae bacterium]|nr:antitoxin MazE [Fimbriimonadaceae bacterium]